MSRLDGKRVLVTGASSGIGKAVALLCVQRGALVAVNGRNAEPLQELVGQGAKVVCVGDLTEKGTCERVVREAREGLGGLDCLVNCAGVLAGAPTQDTTMEIWDNMFNVNTRAVFEMMHHAIPALKEGNKSAIVNISSVNGLQSFGGVAAYCASKSAVDQLTRCAAVDLAPLGIRINNVNPGVIITDMHKRAGMDSEKYAAFLERCKITHPLGRPGQVEEVSAAVVFLLSDDSSFTTGQCLAVDGGRFCLGAR